MHVLLLALGSHGDVHPFIGIAQALRVRGHAVTIAANEMFGPLVARVGFDFAQLGTEEEFRTIASDPAMWSRPTSFKTVAEKAVIPGLRPMYDLVMEFIGAHPDAVVAGSSLAIGMRLAEDKMGIPMAMIHLAPAILPTEYDTPMLPGSPIRPWTPRLIKRFFNWFADAVVINRILGRPLNAFRHEIGLPPVKRAFAWWNNPALLIGMWPEWFGPTQPDWPKQLRLTGFPLYDEKDVSPISTDLHNFLTEGPPPIAFTAGSAMWSEHHFFEESAAACTKLNMRGLLLTRHRDAVPATLPRNVIHVPYAPFSALLPRCAAIVHHGGIGTTAQSLAAGIPQLVMPFSHDQLDNANRVVRFGAGRWVEPKRYRAAYVAEVLKDLATNPAIKAACIEINQRLTTNDGVNRAADLIESLPHKKANARPGYVVVIFDVSGQSEFHSAPRSNALASSRI